MIYYPVPIHLQPVYAHLGYRRGDLPVTEQACEQVLSLPMFPELLEEQSEYVAEALGFALASASGEGKDRG
jgi:dTDP-4-amino-4,6-dideoxygalactose transaminase